jgi:predicted AlkP superfamily phosphohydrolase/phosphomutase
MSDHGFTSWRRTFNLNSWLRDNGYLSVIRPEPREDPGYFENVDWSRTRAYGLGLNGLYINVRGRERWGIVAPEDRKRLVDEIGRELLEAVDPNTGRAVVTKAYPREQAYPDSSQVGLAPDLIVGYAAGTRVSNESALGGVTGPILVDNTQEWSGDHSMDPDAVPAILLTSRRLRKPAASLQDLAGAILAEFDIDGFPASR